MNNFDFKNLNSKSWHKLLSERFPYNSPKSVAMRCQPPHSQFFMQPCPSLGLMALPVYDNFARQLPDQDFDIWKKTPSYYIGFAFQESPGLANIYQTTFRRIDGKTPIIEGQYHHNGIKYTFTYYTNTYKKYEQDTTRVECRIENISNHEHNATVRMKPYLINMHDFLFSHYITHMWDTSKWNYEETCSIKDKYIYLHGKILAKITDTDMDFSIEDKYISDDYYYRHHIGSWKNIARFSVAECDNQYLKETVNTIKFTKMLQPKETAYFTFNAVSNYEQEDENISFEALNATPSADTEIKVYEDNHRNKAFLNFKDENIDEIYYSNLNTILQLTVDFEKVPHYFPVQGGIDERHLMWLWEAYFMLLPLLNLGYWDIFRSVIDYVMSLQESTYKPNGQFTDLDGAIGTPGPKWVNTTATAISYVAGYFNITKEREVVDKYLDNILKAGHWIVRQLHSTRDLDENGEKAVYYGLMPMGQSSDCDYGYGLCLSDSYTYAGLRDLTEVLKNINHAEYDFFAAELAEYKENIAHAINRARSKEGNIPIVLHTEGATIGEDFDCVDGALNIIYNKACDPDSKDITDFIDYFEKNSFTDYLSGTVTENSIYTGCTDLYLQQYYIPKKEYKKAWECLNMAFRFGMSQDTYQVQERYCFTDEFWCPWQPNGSGSGRILLMILNAVYTETDDEIILFGGFPYEWLMENGTTELRDFYMPCGKISVKAVAENDKIYVTLSGDYSRNKKITVQDDRFVICKQ